MAHYDAWRDHLMNVHEDVHSMSFELLHELAKLPTSAWKYDWWWANEDPTTTSHVQCKSWQAAGFDAEVDREHAMVTFRRKS